MKALLRFVLLRIMLALALVAVAGLLWTLLGFATSSPESAARASANVETQNRLVPGSFHVLTTVSYPGGRIVVYNARVRAWHHMPAMEVTGEQAVNQVLGHWAGSSGGLGGPVSNDPTHVANVSQTAFMAGDRSMYSVLVVRPLSARARTLNLMYRDGRTAHIRVHRPLVVTVTHAPNVRSITISDARGTVVWPVSSPARRS